MPFRFKLNGTDVSCDTPEELRNALALAPNQSIDRDERPVGKRSRKSSAAQQGSKRMWALARFFAETHKNTTITAARTQLAHNPKLKEKIEEAYAASLA